MELQEGKGTSKCSYANVFIELLKPNEFLKVL